MPEEKPEVKEEKPTEPEPVDTGVTEEDKQLDIDRDNRTIPVVKLILELLAKEEDLKLGSQVTPKEKVTVYIPIVEKVIKELLAQDVRHSEVKWIFDMLSDLVTNLDSITKQTINSSSNKTTAFLYGAKDFDDITVNHIHKVLQDNKL